jgi:hypothetical protein
MRQADASDRRTPIIRIATRVAHDVKLHQSDRTTHDAQLMTLSRHSFAKFRCRASWRALADATVRMKGVDAVIGDLIL